jgi:hypothetical protein
MKTVSNVSRKEVEYEKAGCRRNATGWIVRILGFGAGRSVFAGGLYFVVPSAQSAAGYEQVQEEQVEYRSIVIVG